MGQSILSSHDCSLWTSLRRRSRWARSRRNKLSYEHDWWFENHPGCFGDASDNRWTDNIARSGDERMVRTTYNPLVQWSFVQMQARAALHLPTDEARECAAMAKRAADYGTRRGHDGRTLFLAAELRARLEMRILPQDADGDGPLFAVARRLLDRQVLHRDGLAGFFLEEEIAKDVFRSIAFATEPVFALLRLWELRSRFDSDALAEQARTAVIEYVERYLLADSISNPFSLTPYGVYPKSSTSRASALSRCRSGLWGPHVHAPFQRAGHRARNQLRADVPRPPVGARGGAARPTTMAPSR